MTSVLQAVERGEHCVGNPDLDSYFDAVYAETVSSVSRFVVSHAARFQDTEDIVQNIYTRFYKRISEKGYKDIESAEAFLINIAKFECRSVFAGFRRRKDRDIILSEIDEEQAAAIEADMSRDQKLPPIRYSQSRFSTISCPVMKQWAGYSTCTSCAI